MDAKRDWGFAGDYVEAMHLMLQQDTPDDYVISSDNTNTVREFVTKAFKCVDIDIIFEGSGIDEKGYDKASGKKILEISSEFFRPAEVDLLIGNSKKARDHLNWIPKTNLDELVSMMVKYDLLKESR